jgi:uncharacterized radical SAM superfamily protein
MRTIEFIYPVKTKTISLTGEECALNCAHCNKNWLKGMSSIPEIDNNTKSCLISGGCDINGRVPLIENLELIKKLSQKTKLIAHTGLISEEDVKKIAPFIHSVSFNLVGYNYTIREVFGLQKTVDDFIESYLAIKKHMKVFPHITIGLHAGKINGEFKVLELLKKFGTEAIIFNVFIPTPNTKYSDKKPPRIEEVLGIISHARVEFPNALLVLGCMRPGGKYRKELDEQVIGLVDRIVMPADKAIKKAKDLSLEIKRFDECCIL